MMSLMVGKGACRSKDRKWLDCGMIWHANSLSEALWRNTFVIDDELLVSILEELKRHDPSK